MPSFDDLREVLVDCKIIGDGQWDQAVRHAGNVDSLAALLAALAATTPWWWDHRPPAPPGLTEYQSDAIHARFTDNKLHRIRAALVMNKFLLLDHLGEGGQGRVYRARQLQPNREVAIKILTQDTEDRRKRFEQEARAMLQVRHPAVAQCFQYERLREENGQVTDDYLIAMEYINGTDMQRLVRREGPVPWRFAVWWVANLLDGLNDVHAAGFIHRDVKAGNIFLGPGGHATILDFGILRSLRGHESLTRTGVVMGTPHYMAPEQALGSKDVDHRVDLYALAVVIFECLTGTLPFEADSELRLIQMQAHSPPPDLIDRAPWIARPIAEVMKKALAKLAADRFSSGAELYAALERAYQQAAELPKAAAIPKPTDPAPVPVPAAVPALDDDVSGQVPRSRAPFLALGVAVLLLIALGVTRPWEPVITAVPIAVVPLPVAVIDAGVAEVEPPDAGATVALIAWVDAGELAEPTDAGAEEEEVAAVVPDAGRRAVVKSGPKRGKLNVITTHKGEPYWAQVLIDGVSKGRTPLLLELPTGKYQIRVERPGFKTQSREIRVASGKAAVVRIDLTQ